jgi:hypothetical protein
MTNNRLRLASVALRAAKEIVLEARAIFSTIAAGECYG